MSRNGASPKRVRRIVVKVGTSLLTRREGLLDYERMTRLARELAELRHRGLDVLLVSSGAIAAGMGELGWKKRPTDLPRKQAAAAIGQPRLMESYRQFFRHEGVRVAQVLLTREDFENKRRRENARSTLLTLLAEGVVPIINENDTVAVEEIRVGDNDTLAALVAVKVKANLLVLLTDVQGLMTRPPHHGRGELIAHVPKVTASVEALAQGAGSDGGTGGMVTKVRAAKYATRHGVAMVIASGEAPHVLTRLVDGNPAGTFFAPR
jgi:glutamate 5-kinase